MSGDIKVEVAPITCSLSYYPCKWEELSGLKWGNLGAGKIRKLTDEFCHVEFPAVKNDSVNIFINNFGNSGLFFCVHVHRSEIFLPWYKYSHL